MACTEPINSFECKKLDIDVPSLSEENNRNFSRDMYGKLRGPIYGFFHRNTVYFIGDDIQFDEILQEIEKKYHIKWDINKVGKCTLHPGDSSLERRIIEKIAYSAFEDLLIERGFLVNLIGRDTKVAIPTNYLQSQKEYTLIHDNKYFESFFYKIQFLSDNRLSLQIDPKITVLAPYTNNRQGDKVVPKCFNVDCDKAKNCPVLPRNTVIFEQKVTKKIEKCPDSPTRAAIVFDIKKREKIAVPLGNLFFEPSSKSPEYGYRTARNYSLKLSDSRKAYLKRFYDLLSNEPNNSISLNLPNQAVIFNPFLSLDYSEQLSSKLLESYSIMPDTLLIFGEEQTKIKPYDGLRDFSTYSYNKASDQRYFHPKIRLYSIFPSSYKNEVLKLLNRLKEGLQLFGGIQEESPPYNTTFEYEDIPLDYINEVDYINKVKAKIKNILQEKPLEEGDVFLFLIPEESNIFYDEIKDFCFFRKIRSQMIRIQNLNMYSRWYPLYVFSLSLYSKAGGTPWIIGPEYFELADCYIGLAFSRKRMEDKERFFVGAADVFNALGQHITFAIHQDTIEEEIWGLNVDKPFMKKLISDSVYRYEDKIGYTPHSLAIYRPGRFIKKEIEAIQEVLIEKNIEKCYLIHVQNNTLFRAYNKSLDDQAVKGTYFRVGPSNFVLFPTGYKSYESKPESRRHKMGTPKPVQFNVKVITKDKITREISDDELFKICRSYLGFTMLRWNSLSTTLRDPLTIFASRKVAEFLKKDYKGLEGIDVRDVL